VPIKRSEVEEMDGALLPFTIILAPFILPVFIAYFSGGPGSIPGTTRKKK
jgi:hypothetical protein